MVLRRTGLRFKKRVGLLSRLGKVLELIGKPLYWLIATGILTTFYLFLEIGHLILRFFHLLTKIKLRRPQVRLPTIRLPKITFSHKIIILLAILIFIFLIIGSWAFNFFSNLPDPNKLNTRLPVLTTKIYDRNGIPLYKIFRKQNRTLIDLKDIPLSLVQATISVEDAEFYQHHGFSPKGIFRAIVRNLKGTKLYGGSTITQQLVKNALLTPERTWSRKLKEIILAILVETKFSKDEILKMYLNEVGYGGATYGVEEAAQMYFSKSAKNLNLAESALLAGLPASPTSSSPFGAHPEKAKERQKLVLKRMTQEGFISEDEAEKAIEQELHFATLRTDIKAPHFVMYVKDFLVQRYGERMVEEGGLEIKTTLDLNIQEETQKIVAEEVEKLKNLRISNAAVLVTKPQTGEILAMVGSKDYFDKEIDGNVNVTLRLRQPGSSIKPVNYSIALENGFTPASILSDTPITYNVAGQPPYSPRNYDGRFHGNIPLRIALASSYNVPAVKILSAFGVERMVRRGQEMGITTWDDPSRFGLSLTLGGGEIKMVDLAVVYGTLANFGLKIDLNPVLEAKNYKGDILNSLSKRQVQKAKQALSPEIAFLLTDILSDNTARTPAFGPRSWLNILNHPHVAVKTGTTQNLRDNWTIGYTPDFLVAVWVGNNDNSPMSWVASGVTGASPIWNKIMSLFLKDVPDKEFSKPEDLVKVEICPLLGTLPCNGCGGKWEYFLPGTGPKIHCTAEQLQPKPTPTPLAQSSDQSPMVSNVNFIPN